MRHGFLRSAMATRLQGKTYLASLIKQGREVPPRVALLYRPSYLRKETAPAASPHVTSEALAARVYACSGWCRAPSVLPCL
mmetsp:Transcript_18676/g.40038  ORF Transcript_18676/g.40038 Transcript_18676/m.40038 type:complete len:81 (-) Transcript_18676:363-605(-)